LCYTSTHGTKNIVINSVIITQTVTYAQNAELWHSNCGTALK